MAKGQKPRKKSSAQETTVPLRAMDGTPFYAIPTEAANNVRRMITGIMHRENLPARISVIATLRKEGVTYISLALAATLANDLDTRVCALELNWYNPGMYDHLSTSTKKRGSKQTARRTPDQADTHGLMRDNPGLAGVLLQRAALDDVLIQTDRPNLSLLPAGDLPMSQRPLIARSDMLKNCIEELNQRFDHLILDIPAIMLTSDAIALASLGSACCMVVHQGITPVNDVKMGLDEVKHLPMLGVVLNKTYIHTPRWIRAFLPEG
jgi:ATPases involved in chromosome partitioning